MAFRFGSVNATLGLTASVATFHLKGGVVFTSLGLTATALQNVLYNGQLDPISLGITATVTSNVTRSGNASASLGLSANVNAQRIAAGTVSGNLGLTATVSGKLVYFRGNCLVSLGLTAVVRGNVKRGGHAQANLGITCTVSSAVRPTIAAFNTIYIFEATNAADGVIYGILAPRDYQKLYLDKTESSYPQPFILLN